MVLVKKIKEDWFPQSHPLLKVGDVINFDNPEKLLEEGKVILVNENGVELRRGIITRCPVCIFETSDAYELADHIYQAHPKKLAVIPTVVKAEEIKVEAKKSFKDMTDEEKKAWRMENLRKAREAVKAKKEAALTAQAVSQVVEATKHV